VYDAIDCPDWFFAWVGHYSAALGVSDELKLAMLRIWWPAFAAAGFVESDFAASLPRLVTGESVPNWPREHLAAVNRELRQARDRRTRRAESPAGAPEGTRCRFCEWTGWVEVPHPACVKDGTWQPPYTRACVACTRCGPGSRKYRAACELAKEPPLTLDHYELRHDAAWAEHLAERDEAERLMRRAVEATESVSSGFPKLARAMAAGTYQPTERRSTRATA
jgi:hypothetical protein